VRNKATSPRAANPAAIKLLRGSLMLVATKNAIEMLPTTSGVRG
jgi:hypothetical protein